LRGRGKAATFNRMTTQENSGLPWHGTTVIAVRKGRKLIMMSDGQVSMGPTIMKGNARKVRRIANGEILAGFAGATADAFTLFERLEQKLERFPGQLQRAAVELAKDWRTERYLQKLEALLIVADKSSTLVITGSGDVLEPEHPVVAIGSGGNFALAAARGLYEYEDDAELIGRKAMQIAADICVYTNSHFTLETLDV
jgi:ATP-dependent HslUV protease subunit HslV